MPYMIDAVLINLNSKQLAIVDLIRFFEKHSTENQGDKLRKRDVPYIL